MKSIGNKSSTYFYVGAENKHNMHITEQSK